MKILMILANPVRELGIYQKIEKALHDIDNTVSTLIIQSHATFEKILRFKPDIVFCFLLNTNTYPQILITLKYLLNFKSFTGEEGALLWILRIHIGKLMTAGLWVS